MELEQELAAHRAKFATTAPEGRVALYEAKIDELRASFPIEQALSVGDRAPEFTLTNVHGKPVSLSGVLSRGSAVVTFYRGGWCPYCNIQLRAYQAVLPDITALGARLIAVSPQNPDASLSTAEKNQLAFDVVSDRGNGVARSFGLVYSLPEELRDALRSNGKALPSVNGDDSWELPLPATFVIAPNGLVRLASVEIDYRERLAPERITAALRNIHAEHSISA